MTNAIETPSQTIAPESPKTDVTPGVDYEARIAALEAEKNKLIEEGSNYKLAYLKEKKKQVPEHNPNEDDDERIRRIAQETLANSRLAEIAREQDSIIKQALKENKELKLTLTNKTTVPSSMGSHTEFKAVPDTLVTAEQLAAFKARGWKDKDIERYKKNLLKNAR